MRPAAPRPLMARDARLLWLPASVRGLVSRAVQNARSWPREHRVWGATGEAAFWALRWQHHADAGADAGSAFQRARMAAHYFCAAEACALADADLSMARQAYP